MPLARGTAAVGYMTLLAVFMAAGMPIEAQIPEVSPVTDGLLTPCLRLELLPGPGEVVLKT